MIIETTNAGLNPSSPGDNANNSLDDDAAFLRILSEKQDVALQLTRELEAWFGEIPFSPARPLRIWR
jgi:hypothetical protein